MKWQPWSMNEREKRISYYEANQVGWNRGI
ncbi:hypothetical protein J2Z32_000945 [Paenibacillus turicensis]|uniref:Uncharacterized protein n=1 Tax=Paenibacillus turicensis TaxID=160487 RepID=A0ABS4FP17_9BACL|nr:hypothetical protein [Paenibacillus turicensis]